VGEINRSKLLDYCDADSIMGKMAQYDGFGTRRGVVGEFEIFQVPFDQAQENCCI